MSVYEFQREKTKSLRAVQVVRSARLREPSLTESIVPSLSCDQAKEEKGRGRKGTDQIPPTQLPLSQFASDVQLAPRDEIEDVLVNERVDAHLCSRGKLTHLRYHKSRLPFPSPLCRRDRPESVRFLACRPIGSASVSHTRTNPGSRETTREKKEKKNSRSSSGRVRSRRRQVRVEALGRVCFLARRQSQSSNRDPRYTRHRERD